MAQARNHEDRHHRQPERPDGQQVQSGSRGDRGAEAGQP